MMYEPGVTHAEARIKGGSAFPRELSYPCEKCENWYSIYDYVSFPSESFKKPFDSVGQSRILAATSLEPESADKLLQKSNSQPRRVAIKQVFTQLGTSSSATPAAIDSLTRPKSSIQSKKSTIVSELPHVGVSKSNNTFKQVSFVNDKKEDVHVYPCLRKHLNSAQEDKILRQESSSNQIETEKSNKTCLEPDPIIKLRKVVGFGGATCSNCILWSRDSQYLLYPCHAIVVSYHITTGQQWSYIGHTDKVSCIAVNKESSIMVSGQAGQQSLIRFWDFSTRNCLAVCKEHDHSLSLIEFSSNSDILCGVGKKIVFA